MVLSVTIPVMEVPLYPSGNLSGLSEWTVVSFDDFGAAPTDIEEVVAANQHSEAANTEESATDKAINLNLILTILYALVGVI